MVIEGKAEAVQFEESKLDAEMTDIIKPILASGAAVVLCNNLQEAACVFNTTVNHIPVVEVRK